MYGNILYANTLLENLVSVVMTSLYALKLCVSIIEQYTKFSYCICTNDTAISIHIHKTSSHNQVVFLRSILR